MAHVGFYFILHAFDEKIYILAKPIMYKEVKRVALFSGISSSALWFLLYVAPALSSDTQVRMLYDH